MTTNRKEMKMTTNRWFNALKILGISLVLLSFANVATAGSWTNWFTIDKIRWSSHVDTGTTSSYGAIMVYPDGTVENLLGCAVSDAYIGSQTPTEATSFIYVYQELTKLVTLAYTAGWQIRLYLNSCEGSGPRNHFHTVELKKP